MSEPSPELQPKFYDYTGVLNVHSKKSTGSQSVVDIITDAQSSDLDFLFFHEEMYLNQKQPSAIRYDGVYVFYGIEQSFKGSDLLYAEIENEKTFTSFTEVQLFLEDRLENKGPGLLVLAHPDKVGFKWKKKHRGHLDGIEVINVREVWRNAWKAKKLIFLTALMFYPFNPDLFFLSLISDVYFSENEWIKWNKEQRVFGFAGSDVTSKLRIYSGKYLNFPGYKNVFSYLKNHLLLREELTGYQDGEKILNTLKQGQFYFSIDILGDPTGFSFSAYTDAPAQTQDQIPVTMGGEIQYVPGKTFFRVELPKLRVPVRVELLRGHEVIQSFSSGFQILIDQPGLYRVRVKLNPQMPFWRSQKWLPWIFSNPIYVEEGD